MSPASAQIGFDRFIRLDWAAAALRVKAGVSSLNDLTELVDGHSFRGRRQEKDPNGSEPALVGAPPLP